MYWHLLAVIVAFIYLCLLVKPVVVLSTLGDKLWISNKKSTQTLLKAHVFIKLSTVDQIFERNTQAPIINYKLLILIGFI